MNKILKTGLISIAILVPLAWLINEIFVWGITPLDLFKGDIVFRGFNVLLLPFFALYFLISGFRQLRKESTNGNYINYKLILGIIFVLLTLIAFRMIDHYIGE
jgi:hypothetical protein